MGGGDSGEREARAILPSPLLKRGSGGFSPGKFFEIADARTCVLIRFEAPKLLSKYVALIGRNNFFWSLDVKIRSNYLMKIQF